ncbi:hypothetical protein GCM10009865_18650 [Aeromicrobium ponti]
MNAPRRLPERPQFAESLDRKSTGKFKREKEKTPQKESFSFDLPELQQI